MTEVVISIHPQHAKRIVSGEKTVEVRTRPVQLPEGAVLWIYATNPAAEFMARAEVHQVKRLAPSTAWRAFGPQTGLSSKDFFSYVNCSKQITLLVLKNVRELKRRITLREVRRRVRGYFPPQSFAYLDKETILHELLRGA